MYHKENTPKKQADVPITAATQAFTIYQTHNEKSPWLSASYNRLIASVKNPRSVQSKDQCWAIHPSLSQGKTKPVVEDHNAMTALVADVDNPMKLNRLIALLRAALRGVGFLAFTTYSSQPGAMRWRVVILLARPLPIEHWQMFQRALAEAVGGDNCTDRPTQIHYGPVKPPSGCYAYHVEPGEPLEPSDVTIPLVLKAAGVLRRAEAEANLRAAQSAIALQRRQARYGDRTSPVEAFCAAFSIAEMLERYGYARQGSSNNWRSPYQTSGTYATQDRGDHWISLSGSDDAANIGRSCKSGRTGDSFDLFRHYEHDGDFTAAVKAAAELLGLNMGAA